MEAKGKLRPPAAPAARTAPAAVPPTAPKQAAPPATPPPPAAPARRRRRLTNDVPLRSKVHLLVALSAITGAGAAMLHVLFPSILWLLVDLALVLGGLIAFADWWIVTPVSKLVHQLDHVRLRSGPSALHRLPTGRKDEVGRIARTVQQVALASLRDHFEAQRVRRTMDHRVEQATRQATLKLRRMALRDPLTDLGNRRFLDEHLEPLVKSVREAGEDVVAVALDLDYFKQVNDTLGHDAGDELLLFVAGLIRGCMRGEDYAVRTGGDEFILLLPGTTTQRAGEVVERIATLFRQHARVRYPAELPVGLSAGIAALRRDVVERGGAGEGDGAALLKAADEYLYQAKRGGRGRSAGA